MSMMFSLTALTGKEASATRTVVIGTVEFNWRVWMILLWSSPIGVVVALVSWPLLSELSLFMLPVTWGVALFLVQRRTRDGLQLRTYQALWDKKKANTGQFFLCGVPIDVSNDDYWTLAQNSVPYVPKPKASSRALVDVLEDGPDASTVARARRHVEAATRPVVPSEPAKVAAPAPQAFAAAPESVAAHVAPLDPNMIGLEHSDALDTGAFFDPAEKTRSGFFRKKVSQ